MLPWIDDFPRTSTLSHEMPTYVSSAVVSPGTADSAVSTCMGTGNTSAHIIKHSID